MMTKKVALVGHCGADTAYLRIVVGGAVKNASIVSADDETELERIILEGVDLLLLNRQLDYGFPTYEGVELIKSLRQSHPDLKIMLISNYPAAQTAAAQAGALPGFGKREIGTDRVKQLLKTALSGE